ncbi:MULTISPECIES: hypothetical protein [Bacteroides]|jgi:predicted AAA+ superfamily ATPase|uniref:hypothetical protein n=1 Tax=Bacteroides TaxID=816 RepID=UPI0011C17518|nr:MULTISPECIES: hypothetical protein [Bacteroides]QNL38673.1 hypothetical protein H8796_23195 [Bacteroides sp. M10]
MINREQYSIWNKSFLFIDKLFVKVIMGIRRSGTSVVLRLIRDELLRGSLLLCSLLTTIILNM